MHPPSRAVGMPISATKIGTLATCRGTRTMASGVRELLCSERIALLAHQKAKEFVHAACPGRAKILYEMASHDCGKRFSRFAFDNRSRRRFPLAGWLKALPGTRP